VSINELHSANSLQIKLAAFIENELKITNRLSRGNVEVRNVNPGGLTVFVSRVMKATCQEIGWDVE
jgi:hypothetical protein